MAVAGLKESVPIREKERGMAELFVEIGQFLNLPGVLKLRM